MQLLHNSTKSISDCNFLVFAVKGAKYVCCHDSMQLLHNSMKSISDCNLLMFAVKRAVNALHSTTQTERPKESHRCITDVQTYKYRP